MAEAIKPCPFCGGTDLTLTPRRFWTGMRYEITSVEARHFCPKVNRLPRDFLVLHGLTEQEAVEKWNSRFEGRE